nr:MAG TPA: hypothetical protein [Caudoviricetes sp.]
MFLKNISSSLFDESATIKHTLKNPNQFKEAVIYEHMSHKTPATIKAFVNSSEAKAMVEAGSITYDTLDRLSRKADSDEGCMKTAVCHIAKENDDDLWAELVKARAEERRIMNELMNKYRNEADPVALNARTEIIEKCIPSNYR